MGTRRILLASTALTAVMSYSGVAQADPVNLTAANWTVTDAATAGTNATTGSNLTNTTNAAVTSVTVSTTASSATDEAITAGATGTIATIINAGTISMTGAGADKQAILVTNSAAQSILINNATTVTGATITAAGTADTIKLSTTGAANLTVVNGTTSGTRSGTISATNTGATGNGAIDLTVGSGQGAVRNYSGTISSASSDGAAINLTTTTGQNSRFVINNAHPDGGVGTIQSTGTGAANAIKLNLVGTSTGTTTIINYAGGTITAAGTGHTIDINSAAANTGQITVTNFATITNTQNTGGGSAIALTGAGASTGAISINNTNTATISSATSGVAAITSTNRGATTIGITNSGTISGAGAVGTAVAIDLAAATTTTNTITNTGTITGIIKLGTADTLNINAGSTITGAVTTAGDDTGAIVFGSSGTGSSTLSGNLGAVGAELNTLSVAAGNVATHTGSSYFNGTATIGGTYNLSGSLAASTATVSNGGTLGFRSNSAQTHTGALVNDGTIALGTSVLTISGDITGTGNSGGTTGVWTTTINSSGAGRVISTSGTGPSFTTAITVVPTVTGTLIGNGQTIMFMDNTAAAAALPTANVTSTNASVTWSLTKAAAGGTDRYGNAYTTNDLILTATVATPTLTNATTAAKSTVDALYSYNGTDAKMVDLINSVQNLASGTEVAAAGEQLRPDISAGTILGAQGATTQAFGVVELRNAEVRLAQTKGSGVNSGDVMRGLGIWAQGFGFYGDQDKRDGIEGFNAVSGGLAAGMDAKVADAIRVGVAGSYARTAVESKGANSGDKTDIDSYQTTLYGSYTGQPWYVNGAAAFTYHQYDSSRKVAFTGFSDTASADYKGYQYTAKLDAGYPVEIATNTVVTPVVGAAYSYLEQGAYTETSANGSALAVNSHSVSSIKSTLGLKAAHTITTQTARFVPEVRASWVHEFNTEAPETTARFAAGGSSFLASGAKFASDTAVLGLGLSVATTDDVTLSANYDAELKDKFIGHTGSLQVRIDF